MQFIRVIKIGFMFMVSLLSSQLQKATIPKNDDIAVRHNQLLSIKNKSDEAKLR